MEGIINKEKLLTQKTLKELLHYDPLSGIFTWKERHREIFSHCKWPIRACRSWNTKYANKEAGTVCTTKGSKTSYVLIRITVNGKWRQYGAHRLAILYSDGHFPPADVDHINGDGLNNRLGNLREVGHKENMKNKPMQLNNTSGCVGVAWHKKVQKWQVQINVDGINVHEGYFINKSDAIIRRKEMEIEYNFHENHGRKTT